LTPTFSPQGDGNQWIRNKEGEIYKKPLTPTFSPQGDGNNSFDLDGRGDVHCRVDPYLFPARGRKHCTVYDNIVEVYRG